MIYDIGCEFCGNQKVKLIEQDRPGNWNLCEKCSIKFEKDQENPIQYDYSGVSTLHDPVFYYEMEDDSLI